MAALSPLPAYFLGTAFVGLGVLPFYSAKQSYQLFGLAPSAAALHPAATPASASGISPFLYAKAGRDLALGAALIGLQIVGNDEAVTIVGAAAVIGGIVDGWTVWKFGAGDKEARKKYLGHWNGTAVMAGWVALRLYKTYYQ